MKKKTLCLALFFIIRVPALAYDDPAGQLNKLDGLLGRMSFTEAFRAGDRVDLQRKSCTGTACGTLKAHYDVVRANRDSAEVATTIAGRAQPHRIAKVSRAQWEEINGNRARDVVREIESYGQRVTISTLRETSVTLMVNGRPIAAPAYELELTSQGPIGGPSRSLLTLSPACRGPGQIVLRINDDGLAGGSVTELLNCQLAL